jgi:hypothetical protein
MGTKKYFFFIGKDFDDAGKYLENSISFDILNEKEVFSPNYISVAIDRSNNHFYNRRFNNEMDRESLKKELNEIYLKEKISIGKMRFQENMNCLVIHPGESKFLTYYKTLPIFYEYKFDAYYFYKFIPNEKYFVQVSLKNDIKTSKKYFTSNQYKEIETNGYTIFDGTINSNKVPIKFINKD